MDKMSYDNRKMIREFLDKIRTPNTLNEAPRVQQWYEPTKEDEEYEREYETQQKKSEFRQNDNEYEDITSNSDSNFRFPTTTAAPLRPALKKLEKAINTCKDENVKKAFEDFLIEIKLETDL